MMASKLKALVQAGAGIVGGCCGTTPDHIRALNLERRKSVG
jgi:5-methyltetrahydrofolate--homocysteine methyltransferase